MVTLAVRTLGQPPVFCNARPLLFAAHASLERGSIIEAGCKLREAVRLYLHAECEYWGCLPSKKQRRSPSSMLAALKRCEELKDYGFDWLDEIIQHGNALAHLRFVEPATIETCISFAHMYLDAATYLIQPIAAGRLS